MTVAVQGRLVLAIETATADTEVALADGAGPLGEAAVRRGRRHVESLHPAIERVCSDAGVGLGDLAVVAVDIGPGLFTGLRVGVTAAKTLASVLGVPLVALTSLDVLAQAAAPFIWAPTVVIPSVDMRRGEVAWQLGGGAGGTAGSIGLGPPAALAAALAPLLAADTAEVLLVGDGAAAHARAILDAVAEHHRPRVHLAGSALAAPPARVLAQLAQLALQGLGAGQLTDALACVPLYLREADAAINWESRPERPPAPAGDAAESGLQGRAPAHATPAPARPATGGA